MRIGRRLFAIIILLLSGGGLVAYAYSVALQNQPAAQNPCAPASTATNIYTANFRGTQYNAQNVTFTDIDQTVQLANVIFNTISISDPTVPHLSGQQCVSFSAGSASITIRVTYSSGYHEDLTLSYRNGVEQSILTSGGHPVAGLLWQPNTKWIIILVSKT
ncbi:MAG TPA: hypothetical protein VE177_06940 [Candidatus Binatus sp.]|nr:hypothetical protein [Candidatus Binatus sp.]